MSVEDITQQYYNDVVSKDPTLKGKWVAVRGKEIIAVGFFYIKVQDDVAKLLGSGEVSSVLIDRVGDSENITCSEQIFQYIDVAKLQVNDLVKVQQLLPSFMVGTTNDFPEFFIVTKNKTLDKFTHHDISDSEYITSVPIRFWRDIIIGTSVPLFDSRVLDKWKTQLEANAKWNGKITHTWFIYNYVKYEITSQSKEIDWAEGSYMLFHCNDKSGHFPLTYRSYELYTH